MFLPVKPSGAPSTALSLDGLGTVGSRASMVFNLYHIRDVTLDPDEFAIDDTTG
jgi:hypothetical protein